MKRLTSTLVLGAFLFGCGGDGASTSTPMQGTTAPATLEIFSWWTNAGEAEALDALLSTPGVREAKLQFKNIAVANVGLDPQEELFRRMGLNAMGEPDPSIKADPPDLMQWDLYSVQRQWRDKGIKFRSLSAVFDGEGWRGKFYPFLSRDMEFDGQILSLPVGLHRENSLFFNRQLLRDSGVAEASLTSIDGLLAACETLKSTGKVCLATTQEGWVTRLIFRAVLAMTMGAKKFEAFVTGAGDPNDPALTAAVAHYKKLFDNGYVGGWDNTAKAASNQLGWQFVRESDWAEAAKDVHRGRAAFYIHGDWAVGLYKSLGWTATDLGVMAAPGSQGLFIYGADGFLVPDAGKNPDAAMKVVRSWGSPQALAAFNKAKGSTPPRTDVDLSDDPLAAKVASDLKAAEIVMQVPPIAGEDNEDLFSHFAAGMVTADEVVAAIRTHLPKK
jgi:glucose/mannose transport system substrate-binding protein